MITDDLRAKFEAWWQLTLQTPNAASYNSQMPAEGNYRGVALLAYKAAYASRDAEVEALNNEAEEQSRLIEKQSELLHGVAAALKGMRDDGRHNLADLPRLAKAIIGERDDLRQRIESAPVGEVSLDERGCPTLSCDFEEGKRMRLVVDEG